MTYGITGSTGGFGSAAVSHLLRKGVDPSSIVAIARSKEKAEKFTGSGITIRIANYDDIQSLEKAFAGVDRLLLVSSSEVGKRFEQHSNVISAAKSSGVQKVVYTSLTKADTSINPLAPEHKLTEAALQESGLDYVILRNNWYTENYAADVQYAGQTGILSTAAGKGKVASVTRTEYAEAAVQVLTGDNFNKKVYELSGDLWDFNDLAEAAGRVFNKKVSYNPVTVDERKSNLLLAGMDEGTAGFYAALDDAIAKGSLEVVSNDLETLLGHKPLTLVDGLKSILG